jgi:hypothetical protein
MIKPEARRQIYCTMVSIDTLVSIGGTSPFPARKICRLREWCYFRQTDTNVQLHPRVARCILVMEWCQESTAIENELSRVVNAVGDSQPDQKPRSSGSHGHDPTNHKLIHRKRRGEK